MQTSIIRASNVVFKTIDTNTKLVEIDSLYPGYGVTLGNALRRVLLSSLPGASITEIKIKGVDHEFSTIKGIKEDVVEILINLKKVRFKLHGDESQKATLKVSGEKEAYSKEIKTPSQLELVTPDVLIATLTDKKAELEIELKVEKGLGYIPVELRKMEKLEIGNIALDAIFTPVKKVNFEVENVRVGDRTDFNKLKVLIETDGSIAPKEAFIDALKILVGQFSEVLDLVTSDDTEKVKEHLEINSVGIEHKDDRPKIGDLNISLRTINALERSNILYVDDLVAKPFKELKTLRGLGEKGLKEIKKELQRLGHLAEE
jgi:DNA-directed RNA polymerase subunit alpha